MWDAVWKILQPQPSIVASFANLHKVRFQPTLTNLGKCLWWYWCECEAICPSTTWNGAQTSHVMIRTWDAVWKVLQPQPNCSDMVCTLGSARISAIFHRSGEMSVAVMVWVWRKYAHPQPKKVLKPLIYVWHGHGMQFERYYSLSQNELAWFAHLYQVWFQPTFPNLGSHLWW